MATPGEDLRAVSVGDVALSALAFAVGAFLVFVLDPLRLQRDYSDIFDFLWFVPLAITPATYVLGFLYLEVTIPWRSRQRQMGFAAVTGVLLMLIVSALMKGAAVFSEALVFEDRVGLAAMWLLALLGPFVVAWALAPVERRLARAVSHAS